MTTQTITAALPISRNIRLKRRADWSMSLFMKQTNDRTQPLDTTGWTATMTIKSSPNGELYKTLSTDVNGGIVHTPAEGKMVFKIYKEEIALLDFSHAVYEILIVDNNTETTCPFIGDVEMIP